MCVPYTRDSACVCVYLLCTTHFYANQIPIEDTPCVCVHRRRRSKRKMVSRKKRFHFFFLPWGIGSAASFNTCQFVFRAVAGRPHREGGDTYNLWSLPASRAGTISRKRYGGPHENSENSSLFLFVDSFPLLES